ncbi:hypothetical protein ACWGJQ_14835 [Peribacillus simplex]
MNRMQSLCTWLFICVTLSLAFYGIVEEANVSGKTNQLAYILIVTPSLSMTAGLVSLLIYKLRGLKTFYKSYVIIVLTYLLIALFGQIYYKGFKNGFIEWASALVFEVFGYLVVFILMGAVFLILYGLIYAAGKVRFLKN